MKRAKNILVVAMASVLLTGCGNNAEQKVKEVPLQNSLTMQEVVDYYASTYKYDDTVESIEKNSKYEFYDIEGSLRERLVDFAMQINNALTYKTYDDAIKGVKAESGIDVEQLIDRSTYNYIKSYLDYMVLREECEIASVTGAVGYYYVDVKYTYRERYDSGSFNGNIDYVGLHGAFRKDVSGLDTIDNNFLEAVVEKVNEYAELYGYDERLVLGSEGFAVIRAALDEEYNFDIFESMKEELSNVYEENNENLESNTDESNSETEEETEESSSETEDVTEEVEQTSEEETTEEVEVVTEEETEKASIVDNNTSVKEGLLSVQKGSYGERKLSYRLDVVNDIVGYSTSVLAYMPELEVVFNIPDVEGAISGNGIYPRGTMGLTDFGVVSDDVRGELTLRFVIKEDSNGTGNLTGVNVYVLSDTNDVSVEYESDGVIPSFITEEMNKLIERADRATLDFLISPLFDGSIFTDIGVGVLRGYEYNNANVIRQMSVVRDILSRQVNSNKYLLDVETTRVEGSKGADVYARYTDKSYFTVEQIGDKFLITDVFRYSREIEDEPQIYPDSAELQRIIENGLSGEVSEEAKANVTSLLNEWYMAGTARVLNGPKEVTYEGVNVTLNKGMYDCFTSNTELLSTNDKEYMNSEMRNVLTKMGTSVGAKYSGNIIQWLGGTDNQVEITTEELVAYEGMDAGVYMEVYYLVSCINGGWTINERKVLSESDVSGTELDNLKARIN